MESVIILGTGGFAIELFGLLSSANIEVTGFIGPEPIRNLPAKLLGGDEYIELLDSNSNILIAVGNPKTRSRLAEKLRQYKIKQRSFISPESYISPETSISEGTIIYPNTTVHAGVVIEKNVLINSNTTIGHETTVGNFSNVGPGVSVGGCCKIGEKVYIGIGVSIIENITIIDNVIIGGGATVISDIKSAGTYIGLPAKKIEK